MLRYLFFSAALCISAAAYSRDGRVWTLDECIRYAVENSIDVKKQTLSTGRVLDPTTYQFVVPDWARPK